MRKRSTRGAALVLAAALVLTASPAHGAESRAEARPDGGATVTIDGREQGWEAEPLNIQGTVMVPFRELFEALGMEVSWNAGRREVAASDAESSVLLYIGSRTAYVNGACVETPRAPAIVDGAAYVPARFVSEALGRSVAWDARTRTAAITTPEGSATGAALTYDEAVKTGLRKNYAVQSAEIGKKQAKAQNEDLIVSYDYYDASTWQGKNDLQVAEKWAGISLDITREQTANSLRNMMDAVGVQLSERESLEAREAWLKEKDRVAQARLAQGAASESEAEAARLELSAARKDILSLDTRIEASRIELRTALDGGLPEGGDLEYGYDYSPVGEVDLDRKYLDALYEDPYIWYIRQNVESADYRLVTYQYTVGGRDYELTELDLVSAKTNEASVERQLDNAIRSRYNSLLQIEDSLESIGVQLEQAREGLAKAVRLYDNGMAVRADVLGAAQGVKALEYSREKAELSHCQTKAAFEKLYLAPDYMSGGGEAGGGR